MSETVAITTLGCRSNQYDSEAIEEVVRGAGYVVVDFPGPADAYIINTCTVTGRTDYQSRQVVRRARKESPGAVIIVTGCYAQVSPDEVSGIDGVDYVLGNPEKDRVIQYLKRGRPGKVETIVGDWADGAPLTLRATTSYNRTRVNLKVQDGCDRRCSFCIIPMARGRSKSVDVETVLNEIEGFVERGFKEMVLTGIHLGGYGRDLQRGGASATDLTGLLKEIDGRGFDARFRISSVDPDEVTAEMIDLLAASKTICSHLHLPLQSGDDTILRSMARPYKRALFASLVEKLAKEVPGVAVGADIIAGFPGETDECFESTFDFIKDLPIAYLHVFPYSKREGTKAAAMDGHLPGDIIKDRCRRLRELDRSKRLAFYRGFDGTEAEVLVEGSPDRATGLMKGRTANYIPVLLEEGGTEGAIIDVILGGPTAEQMTGVRVTA